jgi:hypothetical protein
MSAKNHNQISQTQNASNVHKDACFQVQELRFPRPSRNNFILFSEKTRKLFATLLHKEHILWHGSSI